MTDRAATPLHALAAAAAARRVASGEVTAARLTEACLDRIRMREAEVRAWSHVDVDGALHEARVCDEGRAAADAPARPLLGIPIGVKDVIDVAGLPSGMGSPIHAGHTAFADAACVAEARAAGAVILGKTETQEFAGIAPARTRHPADPTRTPGGSSSGSAAAVADGMAFAAIGTQTGGSVLRPAAYCGVVGYKPSFGLISRQGVLLAAESFDTVGVITRDVTDAALVSRALAGLAPRAPAPRKAPRIGVFRGPGWANASADTVDAVDAVAALCRAHGASVEDVAVPDGFEDLGVVRATVNDFERARAMGWQRWADPGRISPQLSAVIARGLAVDAADWAAARRLFEAWRLRLDAIMDRVDILLTAAADGEAPEGFAYSGSPGFQQIWTALHAPSLALPLSRPAGRLPLAVQLVGRRDGDPAFLDAAAWVESLTP